MVSWRFDEPALGHRLPTLMGGSGGFGEQVAYAIYLSIYLSIYIAIYIYIYIYIYIL